MKILIIGANGFVGKALSNYFSDNHQVLPLSRRELDITENKAVELTIISERPDLIINCAVLGVEACEINPDLGWAVNVSGAKNLARAAAQCGSQLIYLSTNYVFDGQRRTRKAYSVEDIPEPINVYGQTKLAGERAVQAFLPNSYIIRTSWVFGHGKENFFCQVPHLLLQGKKIRAITDIWANATFLPDLVIRISEIISSKQFGIYHVVNSGLCSYYNFAMESAKILNLEESKPGVLIEPITQSELRTIVKRPSSTPLRCLVSERLGLAPMRDWQSALAEYIFKDRLEIK